MKTKNFGDQMRSKLRSNRCILKWSPREHRQLPAVLLGLLIILCTCSAAYADANSDLKMGQKLIEHHQFRAAITSFDRAIKQNPRLDYAYGLRGRAYLELEKRQEAMRDFNHAIFLNSKGWPYFEDRSRLKYELSDFDGSISDINRALNINPSRDFLYRQRAKLYMVQNRDDKALEDLNKAIELQGSDDDGNYKNRGDLYFRLKKYDLAVKDYTRAINAASRTRDDYSTEQYFSARANAYEKLGKKDLAAADRKKVQAVVKDGWGAFLDQEGKK